MKITVSGKAHFSGTSKRTGNPYDFIQIHYLAPSRGVDGLAAMTLSLDPSLYSFASIVVGAEYNVEFNQRGYVVSFDYLSGVPSGSRSASAASASGSGSGK